MKDKPWIAIDLFTDEVIGNYAREIDAVIANSGRAIIVQYAPNARKVR